jgi:hypothetical protein
MLKGIEIANLALEMTNAFERKFSFLIFSTFYSRNVTHLRKAF